MVVKTANMNHNNNSQDQISSIIVNKVDLQHDIEAAGQQETDQLPGFRFHPTDEELVGFYLRRKVDKKPLRIELIKQVDIYKFDPWDLPKASSVGADKEGYFFCKRGRKYRNSIRPNRVTGSGFWKATGIDKPVYSLGGEGRDCIGLKKTLVYYRGSAGKGTKTDWMMHEFRLPTNDTTTTTTTTAASTIIANAKFSAQEAEVWTLCRIFKRNTSYRKYTQDWRQLSTKRQPQPIDASSSKICSTVVDSNYSQENYVSFGANSLIQQYCDNHHLPVDHVINERKPVVADQLSSIAHPSSMASSSNISSPYNNEIFAHGDWDELRSVVQSAYDPFLM